MLDLTALQRLLDAIVLFYIDLFVLSSSIPSKTLCVTISVCFSRAVFDSLMGSSPIRRKKRSNNHLLVLFKISLIKVSLNVGTGILVVFLSCLSNTRSHPKIDSHPFGSSHVWQQIIKSRAPFSFPMYIFFTPPCFSPHCPIG